jgi:hypothetical protein
MATHDTVTLSVNLGIKRLFSLSIVGASTCGDRSTDIAASAQLHCMTQLESYWPKVLYLSGYSAMAADRR